MDLLTLCIRPRWADGTVGSTYLDFSFPADRLNEDIKIKFANDGFGGLIPFPEYNEFYLTDDRGDIPFELVDIAGFARPIAYKGITFLRKPEGTIKWGYRIMPRVLPDDYRSSPYFDFRSEPGGMNGIGFFAFMLPNTKKSFHASVSWDLSEMPEGARGIFYSAGDTAEIDTDIEEFMMIYFASGMMNSIEKGNFGVYWFGDAEFDMNALTKKLADTFEAYAGFFHDEDTVYRVFLRRDPFKNSGGGTAGTRSFISGYSALVPTDLKKWYSVLAHEILHNWPEMDDHNYGTGTWYNEGCAEYYSTVLPMRAGLVSPEYSGWQINSKIGERYLDVYQYREMSNMDLVEVQWKDRLAQPVTYGRGCLYLANTDAELRRLGKGSIDEIISVHDKKNQITLDEWKTFIRERLGQAGIDEFESMKSGRLITPDPDAFDGRFDFFPVEMEYEGTRFYTYRCKVRGVK